MRGEERSIRDLLAAAENGRVRAREGGGGGFVAAEGGEQDSRLLRSADN